MSERALPELSGRALVARVARQYLQPRWPQWALALVAGIAAAWFTTELVQILEPATNDLIARPKAGTLYVLPLTIVAFGVARALAQVTQATFVNRIGNAVVGDIQVQLFGKLVRADLAHLRSQHSGAYVSSVLYDAGLIREAATSGVVNYTQHLLIVIGAITASARILSLETMAAIAPITISRFWV